MESKSRRRPKGTGSVQELAGGKWRLRLFVGLDPLTRSPRQLSTTVEAKNKTEAQKRLRDWQREVADQPGLLGTAATVRVVVEEWLQHSAARGRSPKTIHEARRSAETVIFPTLGDVRVAELTPRHLDEWYRQLVTGEGRKRPLAATSVRRHHAVLSAALSQAVRWGWLERNPAERAQPPDLPQRALRVPTADEVRLLLSRAAAGDGRWGMLLALAVLTGARRGEICALRWSDIDAGTIRFRKSLYRAGAVRGEKGTKGGKQRWVVVAPVGIALLDQWRERCVARAEEAGVDLVDDAFVVSTFPDGSRPVNPDSLSSAVHRMCEELGMPDVHLHSLRHFAATEMIGSGVDPRNAAELLGHADPSLTLGVYAHSTPDRQRQAAEVLGRILMPGSD
ncbi:MAG TPA: site-specific integrase [Acidimicrobiales bacterium]|nr:site-specific integrase [Acidimicrobiales bacterium]